MRKRIRAFLYIIALVLSVYSFFPGNFFDMSITGITTGTPDVITGITIFDIGFIIVKAGIMAFFLFKVFQFVNE